MTHAEWESSQHGRQQQHCHDLPFDFLHSVPVNHCPDAHGLLLGLCGNVLVCYSGDGRPCRQLIRACRDYSKSRLTLLLHEATYDDEESEMARSKRHCTVSEALGVARDMMHVDATLLTHFSQRYQAKTPRPPTVANNKKNNNNNNPTNVNYGMCQDGLWLPLTRKDLSNALFLLKH
jgi:ribonuclease Z